jgi:hypothetical protein
VGCGNWGSAADPQRVSIFRMPVSQVVADSTTYGYTQVVAFEPLLPHPSPNLSGITLVTIRAGDEACSSCRFPPGREGG